MEEPDKSICPNEDMNEEQLFSLSMLTADSMAKEVFPKLWNDVKDQLKDLSKKELAEEMFHAGASNMLYGYIKLMNEFSHNHKEEK